MKNILIIDDEDDFRVMLTQMLQKAGYTSGRLQTACKA